MMIYPRDYTSGTLSTYRVSTRPWNIPRVLSLPNVSETYNSYDTFYSYTYKPEYRPTFYRGYRDWDLKGHYWFDRRYYASYPSSRYWPYYGSGYGYPYRSCYSSSDYYPFSTYYQRPYVLPSYYSYSYSNSYDRPRYLIF